MAQIEREARCNDLNRASSMQRLSTERAMTATTSVREMLP
jgi:hypothetical protein